MEFARHGLSFEFMDAVDGSTMSTDEIANAYNMEENAWNFKRALSSGEIACALSHRALWKRIAASEQSLAMVCEDDVMFLSSPKPFLEPLGALSETLKDCIIKLDGVAHGGRALGMMGEWTFISSRRPPPRTTGYLIGRTAARRLLDKLDKKIVRPVDNDIKRYWTHKTSVLTVKPQLVTERPEADSHLDASRTKCKTASSIYRLYRNLRYQSNMVVYRALNDPEKYQSKAQLVAYSELEGGR